MDDNNIVTEVQKPSIMWPSTTACNVAIRRYAEQKLADLKLMPTNVRSLQSRNSRTISETDLKYAEEHNAQVKTPGSKVRRMILERIHGNVLNPNADAYASNVAGNELGMQEVLYGTVSSEIQRDTYDIRKMNAMLAELPDQWDIVQFEISQIIRQLSVAKPPRTDA